MRRRDPWKENLRLLGLPPNASWPEIQARYRKLVLKHHPDVNPSPGSPERFRMIAAAYETLAGLRRAQGSRSREHLSRMAQDSRVKGLPVREMEMRLLYSASSDLRAASAYLLGRRQGGDSRRALRAAAADQDGRVLRAVVEALGDIGKPGDLLRFTVALFGREPGASSFLASMARIWLRALKGAIPPNPFFMPGTDRPRDFAWEPRR